MAALAFVSRLIFDVDRLHPRQRRVLARACFFACQPYERRVFRTDLRRKQLAPFLEVILEVLTNQASHRLFHERHSGPCQRQSEPGFGPGGLIEDLKLGLGALIQHRSAFKRIAVVSDKDWVAHALHAFAWMVPGELALFSLDEFERAKEWAAG
jgi:hypothetical protein